MRKATTPEIEPLYFEILLKRGDAIMMKVGSSIDGTLRYVAPSGRRRRESQIIHRFIDAKHYQYVYEFSFQANSGFDTVTRKRKVARKRKEKVDR
jgi:hypothetical protein